MAKYKIVGLPKQTEEYFELDLTPEEIEEYARGGFIVEDISVPSLSHAQDGGEPKRKKHRFIKDTEEAKEFPVDEWGQYIQEEPEVVVRPLTPEQQQARNMEWGRMEMARRNPHLYLPDGTLRPQAAQSADWVWQLGAMGPAGLEGLGALAAKQIPRTGLTIGTVLNAAAGIHGATQVPQRIQDWQDVAEGKKDWREATAESLMTGLELYGGYDAAKTLLPQTYKINPWAGRLGTYNRVVGDDAIADLQSSGLVRAGDYGGVKTDLGPFAGIRTTPHPSFGKGAPRQAYIDQTIQQGKTPFIISTDRPMRVSNLGNHGKGSTMFPVDETGKYMSAFSADDVKVFDVKPHWLKGYKEVPRELPGSPNSFSIFPRKPIPLSDRSLEFGKASKTIGGDQIPEHQWFNERNKKLYDEYNASLEEQAKRSQELSDFDAAAAMDKINASKLGPGAFEKLIMGDDLLWKIDDFADTPRIPYTRKDLYREGNKLFPKVKYKPMDPFTKEQINVLNNYERSTNMLNEAEQAVLDIKALRTEMDPREFVRRFRYELIDPKTGKPFSPTQIKTASPKQISSWRKQIERNLLNPIYTEIQLQGLLPKVKASDFKYYSNKEGGQINSSKNSKLSKFIS
jgi:hypothetical protein